MHLIRRNSIQLALACLTLCALPVLSGCDPTDDPVLYKPTPAAPIQLIPEPTEPRTNVSTAMFNSIVHMAWLEQRVGMTSRTVKYSFSGIGTGFAANIATNTVELTTTLTGAEDVYSPKVVVGPVGEVTVVWSEGVLGSRSIAFATKPTGTSTFGPISYMIQGSASTPAIDHANPDAHYDDNGALHVVWEAGSDIMYRQRPLSGTLANALTLDAVGSSNPFTTPSNPSVMTDEAENVMVAFEATQNINGSPRRVIRIAASDNGGGSFNLVGVLGGAGQQIVAGLYEPKLFRIPGIRQVGAVIRQGNERQRKIQSAAYVNLGAQIAGGTIVEHVDDEAPVGQVSSVRSPRVTSSYNAILDTTEVYVAWLQGGEVQLRASTTNGNSFGEAVTFSTGAGVATTAQTPSVVAIGDWLTVAWDANDTVNTNRAIFFSATNVANRYDPQTP